MRRFALITLGALAAGATALFVHSPTPAAATIGQLGKGGTTNSDVPVPVRLSADTTGFAISAGDDVGMAIAAFETSISLTASPETQKHGGPVTLTAIVYCQNPPPFGAVHFQADDTVFGTAILDRSGEATLTVGTLKVGTHYITAEYGGSDYCDQAVSNAVRVTITAAASTTPPTTTPPITTAPPVSTPPTGGSTSVFRPGPGLTGDSRRGGLPSWLLPVGVVAVLLILTGPWTLHRRRGRHS